MMLFRYEDRVYSTCSIDAGGSEHYGTTPVTVEESEYEVTKETPHGYWIGYAFTKKWVSKTGNKRFAYPTKEQALNSFKIRKTRQIGILQARLNRATEALRKAESVKPKTAENEKHV